MYTSVGISMSLMVYMAVSVYSLIKFYDLVSGNDPNVTSNILYGKFSSENDGLRLADTDFKFKVAFAVKEIDSLRYPQDSDFVEWEAVIVEGNLTHNNNLPRKLPIHKCDDTDYAEFYPPSHNYELNMQQFDALKPHLFCINDTDEMGNAINQTKFFGPDDGSFNRRIDIIFKPCTPQMLTAENKHLKDKKCLANLADKQSMAERLRKSIEYLGEPEVKLVYNNQRIDTSENSWGKDTVKHEMKLVSKSFSAARPTYFHYHLRQDVLIDEASLIQMGQ